MNKTLAITIAFSAGAALSAIATNYILKKKYEEISRKEINDVKERYHKDWTVDKEKAMEKATDKYFEQLKKQYEYHIESEDIKQANKDAEDELMNDILDEDFKDELDEDNYLEAIKEESEESYRKPYLISPDELGEEFTVDTLTYYADGVLADTDDIPLEDPDATVGAENLKSFGEFEDDSVFVRNERLKLDFEILLDVRNHREVNREWYEPYVPKWRQQ